MAIKTFLIEKFSTAASTNSGRVHIVPSRGGWSVKKEGAKRATFVTATKESAVKAASNIKSAVRVIVHMGTSKNPSSDSSLPFGEG